MFSQAIQLILLTSGFLVFVAASPIHHLTQDVSARESAAVSHALLSVQYYENKGFNKPENSKRNDRHILNDNNANAKTHQTRSTREPVTLLRSTGENGYIGGLYMCTSYGFQGNCSYAQYGMNTCYNLLPPFATDVSSFSPDQYAGDDEFKFRCSIFNGAGCTGTDDAYEWPGTPNLWLDLKEMDNQGKSIKCDFLHPKGLETYKAWKEQGYDFNRYIEREEECETFCE